PKSTFDISSELQTTKPNPLLRGATGCARARAAASPENRLLPSLSSACGLRKVCSNTWARVNETPSARFTVSAPSDPKVKLLIEAVEPPGAPVLSTLMSPIVRSEEHTSEL